jgi:hypothetical protein
MDARDVAALQDALVSHAKALGVFEAVIGSEPKKAPGPGLTAAVYFTGLRPARTSGLASTSLVVTATVRLYLPAIKEPANGIDPVMLGAAATLMASISGDFTLDGMVRNVDLLGYEGAPMDARAGYLEQDGKVFRVGDITVPMILNDEFVQVA